MEAWVREYRERHPLAAHWAAGSRKVRHGEETQGRVFRMAEQLRAQFDWPTVGPLFSVLRGLDEVVDGETPERGRPDPVTAAAAAAVAYKILFKALPPLEEHGWPQGFERYEQGTAARAAIRLQGRGFDPFVIDGADPAAYLWALFEIQQRRLTGRDASPMETYAKRQARCIAAIPAVTAPIASSAGSPKALWTAGQRG